MSYFKVLLFLALGTVVLSGCTLKPPPLPDASSVNLKFNESNTQPNNMKQPTGAILKTNYGDITITFYQEPVNTVKNFVKLVSAGFYDSVKFHRVIKQFMLQTGDPNSKDDDWSNDGRGGPGYTFADEFNEHKLVRGSVAMANSGPDTNGSQFFIVTAEATPWLDGKHTNFGYVSAGMDVVDKIEAVKTNENDHPIDNVIINNITLLE